MLQLGVIVQFFELFTAAVYWHYFVIYIFNSYIYSTATISEWRIMFWPLSILWFENISTELKCVIISQLKHTLCAH